MENPELSQLIGPAPSAGDLPIQIPGEKEKARKTRRLRQNRGGTKGGDKERMIGEMGRGEGGE